MHATKRLRSGLTRLSVGAFFLAAGISGALADGSTERFEFGVYDPREAFSERREIDIEHIFMPWHGSDLAHLHHVDDYARQRGRSLQITLEPWTWNARNEITKAELREGIFSGRFDATMARLCRVFDGLKSDVTVRFAHEMNHHTRRYPWSNWRPQDYVRAYRRMIGVCKSVSTKLRYMWSPLGPNQLDAYYPGSKWVDVVGFSVYGYQPYDRYVAGHDRTFIDIFKPDYDRAAHFGKPIVVAELGYTGDRDYIAEWDRVSVLIKPVLSTTFCQP